MPRVILKLSGEYLKGEQNENIVDPKILNYISFEIKDLIEHGYQVGVVIGAGNIWRGKLYENLGMNRTQADFCGMLGTAINSLALQDCLETLGVPTRVMSAIPINDVCEPYIRRKAINNLDKNYCVIFACGTGSPFFSTDSGASLRAAELNCNTILMAKNKIDGVYDSDPRYNSNAKKYTSVTHNELLEKKLEVMDLTAITMCQENKIDIVVYDISKKGNTLKAANKEIGTTVSWR
jgi:uridylate kinase